MDATWNEHLDTIQESLRQFKPEVALASCFVALILLSFFTQRHRIFLVTTILGVGMSAVFLVTGHLDTIPLFGGMLRHDGLSVWLRLLIDCAAIFTCLLSTKALKKSSAYFTILSAVVLGAHILAMSNHFVMIFMALELVSIGSYALAGFLFNRPASEGSMKYFLFGAASSATMLYGFSLLYGITGTLDLADPRFTETLASNTAPIIWVAGLLVLSGFLFKIAAAPMHLWAPDVYTASPIPVMAFFSVVPKLAGFGVLIRFVLGINTFSQSPFDWQSIMGIIALLTITVGNFAALRQSDPKRLMAYSSIAQSGFMLVGLVAFLPQGIHGLIFYASVYLIANFAVFACLQFFEGMGILTVPAHAGKGNAFPVASVVILVGFVSLTGLPPTAGFTAKLFVFSALWEAYRLTGNPLLVWLLAIGLLNTVVSLFYYLRIPYYQFLRPTGPGETIPGIPTQTYLNYFGLILVILAVALFFVPGLLMGWINKTTFAL